jgi:hypothetical protein
MNRALLLSCMAALALFPIAGEAAKLPPCQPKRAQIFLSPMGEPFRAGANDPYPSALWFAQADADHDGKLTRSEMIADADRFFARLDSNHDGEITPTENRVYEDQIAPEIRSQVGREDNPLDFLKPVKRDKRAPIMPEGAGRWSSLPIPQPVIAADSDMNRGVSQAEFRAAANERFGRLDTTGRGYLTLATMAKPPMQAAAEAVCLTAKTAQ